MRIVHPKNVTTTHPTKVLAIFDLDKTIINTSASLAYGRPLAERGLITTTEVIRMIAIRSSFMLTTHDQEDLNATKEALASMIKGREAEPLKTVAREALHDVIIPYIYAEAHELLEWHREQGHTIAIVTASPSVVVEPIAEELGADILIASELEVEDGLFTGNVTLFNKGVTKVHHIQDIAQEHGFDLSQSYAYSDSGTDVPMLELVGHPTAVNPDRALKKVAAEREWPIVNFRRPEPITQSNVAVLAGAGATLAILGAVATSVTLWLFNRDSSSSDGSGQADVTPDAA
ncbi:HAD-IB family hydrolase [Corynebacterium sp. zg254]|uniref:HAD-IB family hydrolase n=1 Tax=Corynebacterium zhongnanshanii TaxID=2768834 RepID=A0ABQ6VEJ9_9CORY|nr:HAD-IB family hydrolase [Corynebacterium zhongnanshanii]MCR5914316.1 HAD-IB family hydrolase [Corynebacterium sp. zg254]